MEHVARVWSIPESKSYSKYASPNRARLRYSVSLAAILDLASCLPFFIELGMANKDLPTLSWLKAFRMFRISKNEAVFRAFSSVYRVVWYNAEILAVALLMAAMLMVATSTLLWYLQPAKTNSSSIRRIHYAGGRVAEDPPADSQDDFSSIPATFYLAVLMLTGQGTPSGVLPWYTKIIVIITAIFSVPIFVIPAGMLTWGFEAEAERLMRKRRERRRKQKEAAAAGERIVSSSSSSSDNSASDNDASGGGDDDEDDAGGGGGNGVVDGGRADFMMSEEDEDEDVWDEYEAVVLGSDDDDNGGSGATGGDGGVAMAKQDRELLTKVIALLSVPGTAGTFATAASPPSPSLSEPAPAVVPSIGSNGSNGSGGGVDGSGAAPSTAGLVELQQHVSRLESKLDSMSTMLAKLLRAST